MKQTERKPVVKANFYNTFVTFCLDGQYSSINISYNDAEAIKNFLNSENFKNGKRKAIEKEINRLEKLKE
jgi:hypothetical protein